MSIRPLQPAFFREKVLNSAAAVRSQDNRTINNSQDNRTIKSSQNNRTIKHFKSKKQYKNRRSLRKNKNRKIMKNLSFVGVNAAGLGSKLASFDYLLESLKPTVFFVQETKFRKPGKIKSENSKFYQVFELNRKANAGGGLAIGAVLDVDPVWISEGSDEVEILVVEISVTGHRIRCIGGYGPQENASLETKLTFWTRLKEEVQSAIESEAAVLIQMDGNLWAGPEIVKNDPHQCNNNGRLFKNFLEDFPQLTIVNNMDICEGKITRRRRTVNKVEESILDFFLVCDTLKPFVTRMNIDEDHIFVLTKYSKVKGKLVKKDSDHNTVVMNVDLQFNVKKPERIEYFNFKNKECQEKFYRETESSNDLYKTLERGGAVCQSAEMWFSNLKSKFHKCFKKIRLTSKPKMSEISKLLDQRRTILASCKSASLENREKLEESRKRIEEVICNLTSEQNRDKVVNNFSKLDGGDGSVNTNGVWNLKKKCFPNTKGSLPIAKKDCNGTLITGGEQLKELYLKTFIHRLRSRPIKEDFKYLQELKEELCSKRLKYSSQVKSKPWKVEQLLKVLNSLKDNKSRDPHGLVNEIFKPGVAGQDLVNSLLLLMNMIKDELKIPSFMELCNIVAIYKGKGGKLDLQNERGIFIVNVFRSILTKLIYQDNYDKIDKNMSDSNIGARRNKNIRNHSFILNGIINDAVQGKKSVDILIVDYKQCFDSLWLDECVNDLFDAGVQDDHLPLVYEANRTNQVAIKSPFGLTRREKVEKIVLQGETLGPLECSVTIDTFGKECIAEEKHLYVYKGEVGIPPLAMVDDVACPALCGIESVTVNAYLNAKTNAKKLQYGVEKCHQLHVGQHNANCPDLHIDSWTLQKVEESKTGIDNLVDVNDENYPVETVDKEKYLGDIITADGQNSKNIKARRDKSLGVEIQIMNILEDVSFGTFTIEVALILRQSLFLSSLLNNSESWYNVRKTEIDIMESADEKLLRKILEAPIKTPKCMLYLETGTLPIRFILISRRMMFLHYILNEGEKSILRRFFFAQLKQPSKGDWVHSIRDDLRNLDICLDFEQIKQCPKYEFKALVKKSIEVKALEYLNKAKSNLSKVSGIRHEKLKVQQYLLNPNFSSDVKKFTFLLRCRMVDVRTNYRNYYSQYHCPVCQDPNAEDTQVHLLICPAIQASSIVGRNVMYKYEDLYEENLEVKQLRISSILQNLFEERKRIVTRMKINENRQGVSPRVNHAKCVLQC